MTLTSKALVGHRFVVRSVGEIQVLRFEPAHGRQPARISGRMVDTGQPWTMTFRGFALRALQGLITEVA